MKTISMSTRYFSTLISTVAAMAISAGPLFISPQAHSETLLNIYTLALENDPQLRADQANFNASQEITDIQRSAMLPQVNGSAGYNSSNTHASSADDSSADSLDFSVTLQQSLLNFNTSNKIKRGEIDEEIAALNLVEAKQSLMIRTAEAYFNLLDALDQRQNSQTEQRSLNTQLEQAQERFDVGIVPINDVHEARAAFDNAVANTIAADANVGIRLESLAIITGRYHSSIAPLIPDFKVAQPLPNNRQDWIEQALAGNIALQISALNVEAANYSHKATSTERYPQLDGTLSYSHSEDLQDNADSNTSAIGIELTIPIYAGGRYSAQKRQSAQNIVSAEENLRVAQRNTIQETRTLFLSVISDIALIKARKQAILSRQSALDASQAGYDAGTRDIVDVVNAQQNLFQAQRNYSTTLYSYIINSLKLKASTGVLNAKDLEALDTSLLKNKPLPVNS